jgi:hypothetical protein
MYDCDGCRANGVARLGGVVNYRTTGRSIEIQPGSTRSFHRGSNAARRKSEPDGSAASSGMDQVMNELDARDTVFKIDDFPQSSVGAPLLRRK